jgi:hypothetical protein
MYSLVSVECTAPPEGIQGSNWCRYVIERDASRIVGFRRGSVKQVIQKLRKEIEELNARSMTSVSAYRWRSTQQK